MSTVLMRDLVTTHAVSRIMRQKVFQSYWPFRPDLNTLRDDPEWKHHQPVRDAAGSRYCLKSRPSRY